VQGLALNENTKKFFEISIKEDYGDSDGVTRSSNNSISINLSKLDDFKDILDFYEFKKLIT
jgi:hypothetical protein